MEAAKFKLPLATTGPQLCDGDCTLLSKAAVAMFLFFLSVRLKLWEKKKKQIPNSVAVLSSFPAEANVPDCRTASFPRRHADGTGRVLISAAPPRGKYGPTGSIRRVDGVAAEPLEGDKHV